eukprot:151695_1
MSHPSIRSSIIASVTEKKFPLLYSLVTFATFIPATYIYFRNTKGTGESVPFMQNSSDFYKTLGLWCAVSAAFHIPLLTSGTPLTHPGISAAEREELVKSGKGIRGIVRITRHPLFFTIGFLCLSQIFREQRYSDLCFYLPLFFECIWGAYHQDMRLRQWYSTRFFEQTSWLPLGAVLAGKQSISQAFKEIGAIRFVIGAVLGSATFWYLNKK